MAKINIFSKIYVYIIYTTIYISVQSLSHVRLFTLYIYMHTKAFLPCLIKAWERTTTKKEKEDLLLLSSLFHFFYFIFSAPISLSLWFSVSPTQFGFVHELFVLSCIGVWLIYTAEIVSSVQQSEWVYIYIYLLFSRFFSHMDHYRVLSRVSCAKL